MSLLRHGIERLGFESETIDSLVESMEAYLRELELWNKRRDLVNATGDQLIVKHVLDSLSGVPFAAALPHETIVDVGSGAGFPGIPIALCLADSTVSLVERSARRAAFLRDVVLMLDLKERVAVIEKDLERIDTRFSLVTFRAFRQLKTFARPLFRLVATDGAVMAYKGRRSVVERELTDIDTSIVGSEVHPVKVPGLEEERTIVVIRPKQTP